MADSEQPTNKTSKTPKGDEQPKSSQDEKTTEEITVKLPSPDGSFEAIVIVSQNSDATKPPHLTSISRCTLPASNAALSTLTRKDRETHIILSLGSGHQEAENFYQDVICPILTTLYSPRIVRDFRIHITKSATSIIDLISEQLFDLANGTSTKSLTISKGKPVRIILASGDGGIVDLVNGFLSKPTSSGYIAPQVVLLPLGTANALYHSINAGKENTWGLSALASTTTRPLPIFTAAFSPGARLLVNEGRDEEHLPTDESGTSILHGAVVASWGMHASLVADSDTSEYRKFGVDRFKMAAKEALYPEDGSPPHPYRGIISILQGDTWKKLDETEHMYILATLVSHLEASFCISPASEPLDESMHLVHFGPTSGEEAMRIMGLAYQGGNHVAEDAVRYEAIDGLRIDFTGDEEGRWRRVCVDGKIVRVESGGWVEIRKQKRRVLEVVVG